VGDKHFSRPRQSDLEIVDDSLMPRVATAFAWGADVVNKFWPEGFVSFDSCVGICLMA
jgi:hypothetical protein